MDEPQHGGCRSFVVGGCLLAFTACILAFLAVIAAMFLVMWSVQFVWSFV